MYPIRRSQSLDAGGGTAGDMAASKVGTATTSAVADGASSVMVGMHSIISAKHHLSRRYDVVAPEPELVNDPLHRHRVT
jgi:hypothetical protein